MKAAESPWIVQHEEYEIADLERRPKLGNCPQSQYHATVQVAEVRMR